MKFNAWASLKLEPQAQVRVEVESRAVGGAVVKACQAFDARYGRGGYKLTALILDGDPWAASPPESAASAAAQVEMPF